MRLFVDLGHQRFHPHSLMIESQSVGENSSEALTIHLILKIHSDFFLLPLHHLINKRQQMFVHLFRCHYNSCVKTNTIIFLLSV